MMAEPRTIVVIGAGIIGLTTALNLVATLDQSKYKIVIVSREWPTSIPGSPIKHSVNYASMWAGAHVRPIPASTMQLSRESGWLKKTVQIFEQQLDGSLSVGITRCKGIEFLEAPNIAYEQQTVESFTSESSLKNYRKYDRAELPANVQLGYEYDTYCINAPVYCANLLRSFILRGGQCVECHLTSEWEASTIVPHVELVVNASGLGFGDKKCFPVRGQTVLTDLEAATKTITHQKKDGSWSFIIPRFFNGGTVVGGTKEPMDWRAEPESTTRNSLLREASDIAGLSLKSGFDINDVRVIDDIVGRRPMREGGMRIEVEQPKATGANQQRRRTPIVHAYGAGGRGFEISWGVAGEVTALVKSILFEPLPAKL